MLSIVLVVTIYVQSEIHNYYQLENFYAVSSVETKKAPRGAF